MMNKYNYLCDLGIFLVIMSIIGAFILITYFDSKINIEKERTKRLSLCDELIVKEEGARIYTIKGEDE